ncbi:protein GrpE [Clostridium sp. CAG:1193]|nr:protein GrpE [Clostridium sp. CAG:1193]
MEEKDTNKKKKKNDKENELIVELNNKIKELESKLLYKDADLINYRKRKDEEVSNMLKYSNLDMASELLIVVDDLERAIKIDDDVLDDELSKFLSGFKMIYTRLINILNNFEIKEIEALGKEFDPRYHQAVLTDNVSDKDNNIILDVLQKGYMYKDKVIRPAMVKVNIKGEDKHE